MSGPASFRGTITGGIQDISALLPLLGTEQCEKHVGSALDRGFLYSSVTPVSIFGSLGIVRAAFNILVASLNIKRLRFLGAAKLSDGGFNPTGVVAPMITLDPGHPKRFLAETKLESMLMKEHIENAEDLTISWASGIVKWNLLLVTFTFIISSIGLAPYVRLVFDAHNLSLKTLFPLGFGFPILRVVGSGLCVNVTQFLIQLRVLVLLKTRLLFITIDRQAKDAGVDLELEINGNIPVETKKTKCVWDPELASEMCIWALCNFLNNSDAESWRHYHKIEEIYKSQHKRQMGSIDTLIPRWTSNLLVFGLVFGCISTVAGYIGCFYLVQSSTSSNGPLVWLVLEASLSVVRIIVWAINPSWDDSNGIAFEIQLASHAPLITCNKFEDEIASDGIAPLTRSHRFLEEIVAYTGPFPALVVDDVALYYIFTARGGSSSMDSQSVRPTGILYIVLLVHKEHTSRILFKKRPQDTFSIYHASLEPVQGSTAINVRVNYSKRTDHKTHFLTSDDAFMTQLGTHYDKINHKLQKQMSNQGRKASFGTTWAMQRLSNDGDKTLIADCSDLCRDHQDQGSLTTEDIAYLRHGQVARRWHNMYRQLEEWVQLFIAFYTQELLQDVPTDLVFTTNDSVEIVQECEIIEVEFLLIECQRVLELLLISTKHKWKKFLEQNHADMLEVVLQGIFQNPASGNKHSDKIRQNKMKTRLTNELEDLLEKEDWMRRDNMRSRIIALMNLADQRIQVRRYADPTRNVIVDSWKALLVDVSSETGSAPLMEREPVVKPISPLSPVASLTTTKCESPNALGHAGVYPRPNSKQNFQQIDKQQGSVDDARKPLLANKTLETARAGSYAHDVMDSPVESSFHLGSVSSLGITGRRFMSIQTDINVLSWSSSNNSQTIDELEGPVGLNLNSPPVFEFTASWRDKFAVKTEDRYQAAVKNITDRYQTVERNKKLEEAKQMNARCRERADQLFLRLESQKNEFEDLHTIDVLTTDTHELVEYWSNKSLQERKRLQDRTQQYLSLNDESIEAVGGRQNMLRALKRSQNFSFIDAHESNLLTSEDLVSVVGQVRSITGLSSSGDDSQIYEAAMDNVRAAVGVHRDICLYVDLEVTDRYRTGRPYLLFGIAGASFCVAYFHTQIKCDHTVTLRHCVTTSEGKVKIKLNGYELRGSWGQTQAVRDNFTNEDVHLPCDCLKDVGQPNALEILLDDESFGVYWLSDIFLPVRPVQPSVTSGT